jgi:serine/threonine protein kinase
MRQMTAPTALPEIIGGKYRLLNRLGAGAMGTVYAAEHVLTGEMLALKIMAFRQGDSWEAVERFKREARAASKIKSEHVVRVIDADVAVELGGTPYLVMDLLEGKDLEDLTGTTPQAPATVVAWLSQVARALDKAHKIGVIHRDLKPENLFLAARENGATIIKILDFGIAKMAAESSGTTHSGQVLGTPLYMAPEQARGDPGIGPGVDLYALGLIAFRLLSGQTYWTAPTVAGIIGQILYEPMANPSDKGCTLGASFDAWFLRACHRNASERFTSASEMIDALAHALGVPVTRTPSIPDEVAQALAQAAPTASGNDLLRSPTPAPARESGTLRSGPEGNAFRDADDGTNSSDAPTVRAAGGTTKRLSSKRPRNRVFAFAVVACAVVLAGALFGLRHGAVDSMPKTTVAASGAALELMAAVPGAVPTAASSAAPEREPAAAPSAAPAAPTSSSLPKPAAGRSKPPPRTPPARAGSRKVFPDDPLADQK